MDTWDKIVAGRPKRAILQHFLNLWRRDASFRAAIKGKPIAVKAMYGGRTVVRRDIRIRSKSDLIEAVRRRAFQFIVPSRPYLDVDVPRRDRARARKVYQVIDQEAHKRRLQVEEVVVTPNGRHIVFHGGGPAKVKAVARAVAKATGAVAGRTSRTRVVVDASNRGRAAPGSLGADGKPYRRRRS